MMEAEKQCFDAVGKDACIWGQKRVSLIAGLEYEMEWYNENWNETINEHLTRVAGTVQSRLSNLLGLL